MKPNFSHTNALRNARDVNATYAGATGKALFDKIYTRPIPADIHDPTFGRRTTAEIGQDSGDVYALLDLGYNFDGQQNPVVIRQGDAPSASPVLSVPNFYGAHGYDPAKHEISAVFYAAGPNITPGQQLPEMSNVDIAPTIARILGVTPAKTVEGQALMLGSRDITGSAFPDLIAENNIALISAMAVLNPQNDISLGGLPTSLTIAPGRHLIATFTINSGASIPEGTYTLRTANVDITDQALLSIPGVTNGNYTVNVIPEPSATAFLGLALMGALRRRTR